LKLEDLFVQPEYRGRGIAKALFGELADIAQEKVAHSDIQRIHGTENRYFRAKNCARLDWSVLKVN
jgi:GNAT superfamily N-acetyltransferase